MVYYISHILRTANSLLNLLYIPKVLLQKQEYFCVTCVLACIACVLACITYVLTCRRRLWRPRRRARSSRRRSTCVTVRASRASSKPAREDYQSTWIRWVLPTHIHIYVYVYLYLYIYIVAYVNMRLCSSVKLNSQLSQNMSSDEFCLHLAISIRYIIKRHLL